MPKIKVNAASTVNPIKRDLFNIIITFTSDDSPAVAIPSTIPFELILNGSSLGNSSAGTLSSTPTTAIANFPDVNLSGRDTYQINNPQLPSGWVIDSGLSGTIGRSTKSVEPDVVRGTPPVTIPSSPKRSIWQRIVAFFRNLFKG